MSFEVTETSPTGSSARLAETVRQVLRPLVRLLLAHGITFRSASDLLNQVYVEVATAELERAGDRATDSRLTMMTGIHRKALRRHRIEREDPACVPKSAALATQLVVRWTNDPSLRDAAGRPLPLPRRSGGDPRAPSFDRLVRSISSDVHPRTVLEECLRLGVVRVDDAGSIHVDPAALEPSPDFGRKLDRLGCNVRDHLEAAIRNLECGAPTFLERGIRFEGLQPADVSRLARFAEQQAVQLLDALDRRARALRAEAKRAAAARDAACATPHEAASERASFGLYFFRAARTRPDESAPQHEVEPD